MLADIELVTLHGAPILRARLREPRREARDAPDDVESQLEAIEMVQDDHIEWRRRRTLLVVAADVEIVVIAAIVRQPMDERRIAVEGEDDGLVGSEKRFEVPIIEPVRMLIEPLK